MDDFARGLLRWYDRHGRHDLPWQDTPTQRRTPYRVWISEVMLQQTRVATVIPYFERFVTALPDVPSLAGATSDAVLALWSGLGYYRRAHQLRSAARICAVHHGGELPRSFDLLLTLPGIGRSTAGAILALGCGERHAILDGNVKRVLSRYHGVHGWPGERDTGKVLWTHAEMHTPNHRVADYTQAIMDLGATLCVRANPRCEECPLARDCVAFRNRETATIPAARPNRALPQKNTVFIILRDRNGRTLLQRRPPDGVWPGLWSLPEAPDAEAAEARAPELADLGGATATTEPEIRHTFTHFRLLATPMAWHGVHAAPAIADSPDMRWCSRTQIAESGLPTPIRKLLKVVEEP